MTYIQKQSYGQLQISWDDNIQSLQSTPVQITTYQQQIIIDCKSHDFDFRTLGSAGILEINNSTVDLSLITGQFRKIKLNNCICFNKAGFTTEYLFIENCSLDLQLVNHLNAKMTLSTSKVPNQFVNHLVLKNASFHTSELKFDFEQLTFQNCDVVNDLQSNIILNKLNLVQTRFDFKFVTVKQLSINESIINNFNVMQQVELNKLIGVQFVNSFLERRQQYNVQSNINNKQLMEIKQINEHKIKQRNEKVEMFQKMVQIVQIKGSE
ncbi:Hypothetical_protein [Hexamita inflata]|uniref:Hypothetical_protein n=1 Tax=Hexamita inflata TaxID=28002 RepID=A0AA86UMQ6_9EUKA|nr:Hypothetical protein HINF_LOCUS45061 [Hexamita inflata]